MTTDLRGPSHSPEPGEWPTTPGEFAALWNELPLPGRGDLLARIVGNARAAHECWARDHVPRESASPGAREAGRLEAWRAAVDALETAGMVPAARVVDGLAALARMEGAAG